jgi:GntR family transcriptional regulator, transcriptional repressor for pyruvate dehydrogenase complex
MLSDDLEFCMLACNVSTDYLMNRSNNPESQPVKEATPPTPRRVRGLVTEVVTGLSSAIQSGTIKTGEKLPSESEIMARFDVSRTVVREAISRLQASGRVETRHGIGTFVLEPSATSNFRIAQQDLATVADVIAVLELRIGLETEAAGLAAQRRSEAHLAAIAATQAIADGSDAVPSDFQFHMDVARATGNPHFADFMTYLGTMLIPRTRVNTASQAPEGRSAYLQRVLGEHQRIHKAIRDQNPKAASAAMHAHLSNSSERLRRAQSQTQQAGISPG